MIRLLAGLILIAAALIGPFATAAPAQQTTATDQPSRLMLVLDASGSMAEATPGGQTRIDAAREALNGLVAELPEDQEVGLRVYGAEVFSHADGGACTDSQLIVDPATQNRTELADAIDAYEPYGETPTGFALAQAGEDLGDEGPRTIVLVSDGETNCEPDPCEVAAELSDRGIEVRIDVIGLDVDEVARTELRCIADAGHGTYYDVADAEEFASALRTTSLRAAQPYVPIGRPVDGGPDAAEATPIGAGDSLDTLGATDDERGERWYTYTRTQPGSTVHVAASIKHPGPDNTTADGLHIHVYADERRCDSGYEMATRHYRPVQTAHTTTPSTGGTPGACLESETLTFMVSRGTPSQPAQSAGVAEVPVEIRIIEEPPITNEAALNRLERSEASPIDLADATEQIVGAGTFAQATRISSGTYRGTLVPGETQIFAVDADWGQTVSTAMQMDEADAAIAEALSGANLRPSLWVHAPTRAPASAILGSNNAGIYSAHTSSPLEGGTHPVAWPHRSSLVDVEQASAFAGGFYVVVSLSAEEGVPSVEIPFAFGVDVHGDVTGVPEYASEPVVTSPTDESAEPSDDETGAATTPEAAASTADGGSSVLMWSLLGGGGLTLAGAGGLGWWLLRRGEAT